MTPIQKLIKLVLDRAPVSSESKPVISGDGTTINTQRSLVFQADTTPCDPPPDIQTFVAFHWVDNDPRFGVAIEATFGRSCTVHNEALYDALEVRSMELRATGVGGGLDAIVRDIVV